MGELTILLVQAVIIVCCCMRLVSGDQLHEGRWELLLQNAGVSAMHMTLTHTNKLLIFDQKIAGSSQIMRTDPPCNNATIAASEDCGAHSIEYDIATNRVRPLHLLTDTFCSSAAFASNGTLIHTGGWNDGTRVIRYFTPCSDATCNWIESPTRLAANRWYASNQILPDGRVIVVGGRRSFNYEFVPKAPSDRAFQLPLLLKTNTVGEENNLYPFLHLSSDGNLFVFANKDSILFDYKKNQVVKTFPTMPGGGARNYPSSGSSVMLPLESANNFQKVEILVCGGAPNGAFSKAGMNQTFVEALRSCGRMQITSQNPQWQMEDMPGPRVMGDMLILPTAQILIINGAKNGTAGWQFAREPALSPFLYTPTEAMGNRFRVLAPTKIPRMYHSTASVLPDGRILVAGSNSNFGYRFLGMPFPTELRVEEGEHHCHFHEGDQIRPSLHDAQFVHEPKNALACSHFRSEGQGRVFSWADGSPSAVAAPSGYYLLTIVNGGVLSKAEWIHFISYSKAEQIPLPKKLMEARPKYCSCAYPEAA